MPEQHAASGSNGGSATGTTSTPLFGTNSTSSTSEVKQSSLFGNPVNSGSSEGTKPTMFGTASDENSTAAPNGAGLFSTNTPQSADKKKKAVTFAPSAGGGAPGLSAVVTVDMPHKTNWLALRQSLLVHLGHSSSRGKVAEETGNRMLSGQVYDVKEMREMLNDGSPVRKALNQILAQFERPTKASRESFENLTRIPARENSSELEVPQVSESEASCSNLRSFIRDVSAALDLNELTAAQYVQDYLSDTSDTEVAKVTAMKRIKELSKRVQRQTQLAPDSRKADMKTRENHVLGALQRATTFAELDVIEKILHTRYVSGEDVAKTLKDLMHRAENATSELKFGIEASPQLLEQVCRQYHAERISLLQFLLLILRCGCETSLEQNSFAKPVARDHVAKEAVRIVSQCAFDLLRDASVEQTVLEQLSALQRVSRNTLLAESKDNSHKLASMVPMTPGYVIRSVCKSPHRNTATEESTDKELLQKTDIHQQFMKTHSSAWAKQCVLEQQILLRILSTVTMLNSVSSSTLENLNQKQQLPTGLLLLRMLLRPSLSLEQHLSAQFESTYNDCKTIPRVVSGEIFGIFVETGLTFPQQVLVELQNNWVSSIIQHMHLDILRTNATIDDTLSFHGNMDAPVTQLEFHPMLQRHPHSSTFKFVDDEFHAMIENLRQITDLQDDASNIRAALGTAWSAFLALSVALRYERVNGNVEASDPAFFPKAGSETASTVKNLLGDLDVKDAIEPGSELHTKFSASAVAKELFATSFQIGFRKVAEMAQGVAVRQEHDREIGLYSNITETDDDAVYNKNGPLNDWDVLWRPWNTIGDFQRGCTTSKAGTRTTHSDTSFSLPVAPSLSTISTTGERNRSTSSWVTRRIGQITVGTILRAFSVMSSLELESDVEFVSNICALTIQQDEFTCRQLFSLDIPWTPLDLEQRATSENWEETLIVREEPMRDVLINLRGKFPLHRRSLLRMCTSLIADEDCAISVINFLGCPATSSNSGTDSTQNEALPTPHSFDRNGVARSTHKLGHGPDISSLFSPLEYRFARCTLPVSNDQVSELSQNNTTPMQQQHFREPDSAVKLQQPVHRYGGAISVPKGTIGFQPEAKQFNEQQQNQNSMLVTWELDDEHSFSAWPVLFGELEELVQSAREGGLESIPDLVPTLESAETTIQLFGAIVKESPQSAGLLASHINAERQRGRDASSRDNTPSAKLRRQRQVSTSLCTVRTIVNLLVQVVCGPCGATAIQNPQVSRASGSLVSASLSALCAFAEAEPLVVCAVVMNDQTGCTKIPNVFGQGLGSNTLLLRIEERIRHIESNNGSYLNTLTTLHLVATLLSYYMLDSIHTDVGFVFGGSSTHIPYHEFFKVLSCLDHSGSLDAEFERDIVAALDPNGTGSINCNKFVELLKSHQHDTLLENTNEHQTMYLTRTSSAQSTEPTLPMRTVRCLRALSHARETLEQSAGHFIQHATQFATLVFQDHISWRFKDRNEQWRLGIRSLRVIHLVLASPQVTGNVSEEKMATRDNREAGARSTHDSQNNRSQKNAGQQAKTTLLRNLLSAESLQSVLITTMASLATSSFELKRQGIDGPLLPVQFDHGDLMRCNSRTEVALRETLVLTALRVLSCLLEIPSLDAWMIKGKVQLFCRGLTLPGRRQKPVRIPVALAIAAYLSYPEMRHNKGLGMPCGSLIPVVATQILVSFTVAIENQRRSEVWRSWMLHVLNVDTNKTVRVQDVQHMDVDSDWNSNSRSSTSPNGSASAVSLVALLGDHCEAISQTLGSMLKNSETPVPLKHSVLSLLQAILSFQPGFAAQLFLDSTYQADGDNKNLGVVLNQLIGFLKPGPRGTYSTEPMLHCAALGLLASLWWRGQPGTSWKSGESGAIGFGGLVNQIREHDNFWENLSQSLFIDVHNGNLDSWLRNLKELGFAGEQVQLSSRIANHCFQVSSRSWVLKIMTMELQWLGVGQQPNFHNLLKRLQQEECDHAWLEQYQQLQVFPEAEGNFLQVASAFGIRLSYFTQRKSLLSITEDSVPMALLGSDTFQVGLGPHSTMGDGDSIEQQGFSGMERDLCLDEYFQLFSNQFGGDYLYETCKLEALGGCLRAPIVIGPVVQSLRYLNCTLSLSDAQLELMHAWKQYMESRCLIFWSQVEVESPPVSRLDSLGDDSTVMLKQANSFPTEPNKNTLEESTVVHDSPHPGLPPHMMPYTSKAGKPKPPPDSTAHISLSPRSNITSSNRGGSSSSQHWGDVTSYTLISDLSLKLSHLLGGEQDLLERSSREDAYICETADLLVSMLHFRVFERSAGSDQSKLDPNHFVLQPNNTPNSSLQKRPLKTREARLPVSGTEENPGIIQLVERVLNCCSQISSSLDLTVRVRLRESKETKHNHDDRHLKNDSAHLVAIRKAAVAENLAVSLLTSLMLLFETCSDQVRVTSDADVAATGKLQSLLASCVPFASRTLSVSSISVVGTSGQDALSFVGSSPLQSNPLGTSSTRKSYAPASQMFELSVGLLDVIMCQSQHIHRVLSRGSPRSGNSTQDPQSKRRNSVFGNGSSHNDTKHLFAKLGVFRIVEKSLAKLSAAAANQHRQVQLLTAWLSRHDLLQFSVKFGAVWQKPNESGEHEGDLTQQQKQHVSAQQLNSAIHTLGYHEKLNFVRGNNPAWFARSMDGGNGETNGADVGQTVSEYGIAQLLLDHGVTSVAHLKHLNHSRLRGMGVYKSSDRRRLLQAIDQEFSTQPQSDESEHDQQVGSLSSHWISGRFHSARTVASGILDDLGPKLSSSQRSALQSIATGASVSTSRSDESREPKRARRTNIVGHGRQTSTIVPVFSRWTGLNQKLTQDSLLKRIEMCLQFYLSTTQSSGTMSVVQQELIQHKLVQTLAHDALMRVICGDDVSASETRDNGGRSGVTPGLVRGYTVQGDRCGAHRAWCLVLQLVTSLVQSCRVNARAQGSDDGTLQTVVDQALDFCMGHRHTLLAVMQSYRSSSSMITLASLEEVQYVTALLSELGHHTSRWRLRRPLFEPLVTAAWRLLHDLAHGNDVTRHPMMEEFAEQTYHGLSERGSGPRHVPALCIRTYPVTTNELDSSRLRAHPRKRSTDSESDKSKGEGNKYFFVSHLHLLVEYHIAQTLGHLLSLFSNRSIVKPRWMLETDVANGKALPVEHWSVAEIAFPLSSRDNTFPSISSLVAILQFAKHKLQLASVVSDKAVPSSRPDEDLRIVTNKRWMNLLSHLVEKSLHLVTVSMELAEHERRRQGIGEFSKASNHHIRRTVSSTSQSRLGRASSEPMEQEPGMKELKKKLFGSGSETFVDSYKSIVASIDATTEKETQIHNVAITGLEARLRRCLKLDM